MKYQYVDVNGKKVRYVTAGKGRDMVFVHGWGGSAESLEELAQIASNDFKVTVVDLPGFGHSDMPDPDWGVSEYSKFVSDFLRVLDIRGCIYFGHSFGGSIGVFIAANMQDLIGTLILCSPSFKRGKQSKTNLPKFYHSIKKYITPVRRVYYKIFHLGSDALKFPKLESNFRKILSMDLSHELPKIKQKTLVLWGSDDIKTPIDHAYILDEKIPDSTLVVHENIGHVLPLRKPELVYKDVKRFLKENK